MWDDVSGHTVMNILHAIDSIIINTLCNAGTINILVVN